MKAGCWEPPSTLAVIINSYICMLIRGRSGSSDVRLQKIIYRVLSGLDLESTQGRPRVGPGSNQRPSRLDPGSARRRIDSESTQCGRRVDPEPTQSRCSVDTESTLGQLVTVCSKRTIQFLQINQFSNIFWNTLNLIVKNRKFL